MITSPLNRRDFLKVLGTAGTSLVISIYLGGCDNLDPIQITPDQQDTPNPTDTPNLTDTTDPTETPTPEFQLPEGTLEPNIYLKIKKDGTITITSFRSEMGQGIRTAIAMILAEELDANWDDIRIAQAPADRRFGNQVTGGSASISGSYFNLRLAGAAVRQMLVNAAALVLEVDPGTCTTDTGYVIHSSSGQRLSYGQLAGTAAELRVPDIGEYLMKKEDDFRIIGSDLDHWDAPEISTGKAIFGIDIKLPGMLYAAIARSPVFGGSITNFDASKALDIIGVNSVQVINNKIVVVAENTWAAIKGRDAVEVTWKGGNTDLSNDSIFQDLAARAPQMGLVGEEFLEAVYKIPYQAHLPMEPLNCTAEVKGGKCEVWAPTQSAQDVQQAVQRALGISRDDVIVHVTLMGGGFGRRLQADYAVEAARVSQVIGSPVQVIWTRADDIQHDYYHPLSYLYVNGNPAENRLPRVRNYDGANYIPTGAWRSVGNHPEAFARESFIDEMAEVREMDPLDLRREIYKDRALEVINLAAEKANWGSVLPQGCGRGIAYHATFGVTHVAMVAEVEVANKIKVHRVFCAVDCGIAINPDNIAAQMEGGIAFGLTAALKSNVTLENGRVLESNFHDYPIIQIDEMPEVQVYLHQGTSNPSGIGEMGVPPIAPAVANAIFNATGIRVRHLPIKIEDLT